MDNTEIIMARNDKAAQMLDLRLSPVRNWADERPPKGWLRAIRDALGMTTRQFGQRLGVTQPRIVALEKGEMEDTLTLASLRRAAEALDCKLVYALVPNQPLADTLRRRAEARADEQLQRSNHTMQLENQAVTRADQNRQRQNLVDQFLGENPHRLWDEPA